MLDEVLASVLRALARERVLQQDNGSRPAGHGPMDPGAATEALSLKPLLGFGGASLDARCRRPAARQLVERTQLGAVAPRPGTAGRLPRAAWSTARDIIYS